MTSLVRPQLFDSICELLITSRQQLQQTVNTVMVQTYWQVGHLIVEDEQKGQRRSEYGLQQMEELSKKLQAEFGKGFNARNLTSMRRFYLINPIWNAVRTELSWTHHRILMRIEETHIRDWYITECIANHWSSRALFFT